jgi:hypothetical protein
MKMNVMKKINIYVRMLLVPLMVVSCTGDFSEINTNPNTSVAATPESLLAPAIHDVVIKNQDRAMRIGNELMQVHVTTVDSREFHRYQIRPSESDYMWRNWYLQLTNIKDIYTNAEFTQQPAYKTFMGISLILETWVTSMVTDMFGNVPYSEANKGKEGEITPKFDRQEDIYEDLFKKLEAANELLSAGTNFPEDIKTLDPLYQGNALLWRKFGNSLYLRLLLRVSGKSSMDAGAIIKKIVEDLPANYPVFSSNTESAILKFTTTAPLTSAFFTWRDLDFNGDKGYSDFFINNLNAWGDPRLSRWATLASGVYIGIPSGWAPGQTPELQSTLPTSLKSEPLLGNIMNYAELQFILAEAALQGYISADPKTYYDQGVTNAITHWALEVPTGHLEKEEVMWNEDGDIESKMERIHVQKYYTLFFTDFQQWYEFRRTGHPVLPVGEGVLNDGVMPSRLTYPINVQALNSANYNDAVAAMGGDNINVKVWWDKED